MKEVQIKRKLHYKTNNTVCARTALTLCYHLGQNNNLGRVNNVHARYRNSIEADGLVKCL